MINQNENQNIEEDAISSNAVNGDLTEDIKLEVLSPLDKKDDPRIKKYLKHIKNAVDNKDIKNLALSGVYGSGKSTIIKSFKSKYIESKILNISLASFNETDDYNTFKDQIQLNILQQIIYSQKAERLPESRINRISELDVDFWDFKNWNNIFAFLLFTLSTYFLINFYSYQINPNNWKLNDDLNLGCIFFIVLSLISVSFLGQILIRLLKKMKISKISLTEAEFGNNEENKDLLNKYIDEILYFFEKIPIDIVVIEDLDRFNTTEIYRTLREINFILNTYLANTNNPRKITFLYAIKDDLFANELDRTKFFDLIIPAIPFVNYSNSKNVLNEKLDKIFVNEKVFVKPTKEFINTVSSFITDNRTLLNIINEFIIYKEQQKLEKEELNPEKLLAIIIYKNLRPQDFSRLHLSKSNIDLIFFNKAELIKESVNILNNKIDLVEKELKKLKSENVESIRELNTIYLYHIKEYINDSSAEGLLYDSERKTFKDIIDSALDLNKLYNLGITYYTYNKSMPLKSKLKDIDANVTGYSYSKKYDFIVNKNKSVIEKEYEIKKDREEQNDLNNFTLKQILERKNHLSKEDLKREFDVFYIGSKIEEKDRVYNDPLLLFLLLNGYVDEHYKEYISIFQKGGINETDQEFKINIISRINEPKPYNYELTNIDEIIDELPINYFKNDRILNIDLVNHITVFKGNYNDKFKTLLDVIANWSSKRTSNFLRSYIYEGNHSKIFVIELAKRWDKFWNTIEKDTNFIEQDKKQILLILLEVADDATLLNLNKDKELSSYIANDINLLRDLNEQNSFNRILKILSDGVLDVKFKNLVPLSDRFTEIFDIVYVNNRYEITINNLISIVEKKLDIMNVEKFYKSNLTFIYGNNLEEVISYLELDNYYTYINSVYLKLENYQEEDYFILLKVLNDEVLDIDLVSLFLQKQKNKVLSMDDLEFTRVCDLVFKDNKIMATWQNVYHYYSEYDNSFNEILNVFLNARDNFLDLSLSLIKVSTEKDKQNEFILKLISNDNLSTESYSIFVEKSIQKQYKLTDKFDYSLISRDKAEKLIEFDIIPLNVSHLRTIKSVFSGLHIKLLLRNWKNYVDFSKKHDSEIEVEDFILLLQDSTLREGLKHYIIKNQIVNNDLLNEKLALEVSNLLINGKVKIKDIGSLLNFRKLMNIFNSEFEGNIKVRLINLMGDKLSKAEIITLKDLMERPFSNIQPKSQILLPDNKINWEFIKILQSKGIAGEAKTNSKREIRVWLLDYR